MVSGNLEVIGNRKAALAGGTSSAPEISKPKIMRLPISYPNLRNGSTTGITPCNFIHSHPSHADNQTSHPKLST